MPEASTRHDGDHDRVAMLSLGPDGTPAQHRPELIGDSAATAEATRRQVAEQAVSAVDAVRRSAADPGVVDAPQDPHIADLQRVHEAAAAAAYTTAQATLDALHPPTDPDGVGPGTTPPRSGKARSSS